MATGFDRPLSFAAWSTSLSFTHSGQDFFRGFLTGVSTADPNACRPGGGAALTPEDPAKYPKCACAAKGGAAQAVVPLATT